MLRDRLITAGVIIVFLVPPILFGGPCGVAILVAILGGLAVWELARVLPGLKTHALSGLTVALGLLIVAAFLAFTSDTLMAVIVGFPLIVLILHLVLFHHIENTLQSAPQMIFALAYVIVPLGHAILLRRLDMGVEWILFVLLVICLGDAGAYFAGKYYGSHRFSTSVSPSKTVEGLVGGVAGNFLAMLAVKAVFSDLPSLKVLLCLTLLLALAGPAGDLCASALKRRLEIKDFGTILPGHGGVLDRADSLILAFPTTYYFLLLGGYSVPR
jgi:phosphatidate cytidylyltransferase